MYQQNSKKIYPKWFVSFFFGFFGGGHWVDFGNLSGNCRERDVLYSCQGNLYFSKIKKIQL